MQTTEVVQNEDLGVYVDCEGVQMATYVAVNKIRHQHSLCEVEIFQTKTSKCVCQFKLAVLSRVSVRRSHEGIGSRKWETVPRATCALNLKQN